MALVERSSSFRSKRVSKGTGGQNQFVSFAITGDQVLIQAMRDFSVNMQSRMGKRAMKKAIQVVRTTVKALVPTDTGNLKSSITARVIKSRKAREISGIVETGTRDELEISKGEKGYYPASIEFGYRHFHFGTFIGNKPANSYMRRGLKFSKAAAISIYGKELWAEIRRFAAKEARKAERASRAAARKAG